MKGALHTSAKAQLVDLLCDKNITVHRHTRCTSAIQREQKSCMNSVEIFM